MGLSCDNKIRDFGYHEKEASQLPVQFRGELAREMGIHGTYDREAADRLFRGMRPGLADDKEQRLTQRIVKDRVGAWDWTFNVDKTVSGVALIGGDKRVIDVQHNAVLAAMDYVEKNARVRVRKSAEVVKARPKVYKFPARYTNSLLYDTHVHVAARDGAAHLHTHVRLYNLSKDSEEKCVKAVELRFVDREAANDIYRTSLKRGLNELGYKTTLNGKEIAIAGFPCDVKAICSTRHESIKEMEREYEQKKGQPLTKKAKGKLSLVGRPDKDENDRPPEARRQEWRARLSPGQYRKVLSVVERAKEEAGYWSNRIISHFHQSRNRDIQEVNLERDKGRGRI